MSRILSFEQEFTRVVNDRPQILRYMRQAIGTEEVQWSDITGANLADMASYIADSVSPNSAVTYCAIIKAFLARYRDEDIIPCKTPEKYLKAKKFPQENVALTSDEVQRIVSYYNALQARPGHQPEKDVLTLFLLEVFCGARSCDVEKLTAGNICDGRLTYVSQKTHVLATLPVHRMLPVLLKRKPEKEHPIGVKVRTIKRVAKACGIDTPVTICYHGEMRTRPKYEYLGTHTARRTFASILSEKGVPIAEIAQYMSHTNTTMTERYIKVDTNKVSEAALAFFNG